MFGIEGIEAMEFHPGMLGSEAPVDDDSGRVALADQSCHFSAKGFRIGEPLAEATARQDAELDFRHIEPTAVLGRVVKLQTLRNAPSLCR